MEDRAPQTDLSAVVWWALQARTLH
jgi:hypothetical protein